MPVVVQISNAFGQNTTDYNPVIPVNMRLFQSQYLLSPGQVICVSAVFECWDLLRLQFGSAFGFITAPITTDVTTLLSL